MSSKPFLLQMEFTVLLGKIGGYVYADAVTHPTRAQKLRLEFSLHQLLFMKDDTP